MSMWLTVSPKKSHLESVHERPPAIVLVQVISHNSAL